MPTALYALKIQKQREIERLQSCRRLLEEKQWAFKDNRRKVFEPTLTNKSWCGNHGNEFEAIRESRIESAYSGMAGRQFSEAFAVIAKKITSLLVEVDVLQQKIDRALADQAKQELKTP